MVIGLSERNGSRILRTKDKVAGPTPCGRTEWGSRGAPEKKERGLGSRSAPFSAGTWVSPFPSRGPLLLPRQGEGQRWLQL